MSSGSESEHVSYVVQSDSLSKRYGEVLAVDNLTFVIEAGTITGFLGPNGAGKSTTLRMFLRDFASGGRTVLISSHVLAEIAQTVDQVLIINHGRLVAESTLDELTAHVGGVVRVQSPQLDILTELLQREGIITTRSNDHALLAQGTTKEHVGDVALAAGVAIHELVTEGSSLEEVFLDLTSEVASQ
jgi:ABC-type multidrug transport system ATPase subunit